MTPNNKFMTFLESIKTVNPELVNGIQKAYLVINEATEDLVDDVDDLLAGMDFDKLIAAKAEYDKSKQSELEKKLDEEAYVDVDDPMYAEMIAGLGYGELAKNLEFVLDKMAVLNARREQDDVNRLHSLLREIEVAEDITEDQADELGMLVSELKPLAEKRIAGGDDDAAAAALSAKRASKEDQKLAKMSGDEAAYELEKLLAEKNKELSDEY